MEDSRELAVAKTQWLLSDVLSRNNRSIPDKDFDHLGQCEAFITEMTRVRRVSGLAIALMFVHIRDRKLYPEDETWEKYRSSCKKRLGISLSDIWRYEMIGDAFVMYHSSLEKIGFAERGDVTKLMFLNRAVIQHGKRATFKNFAEMSKIEFELWVKGKPAKIPYEGKEFGVSQRGLLYQNHEVITFEDIRAISEAGKLKEFRRMVAGLKKS